MDDDPDDDPEYRVPADAETGMLTFFCIHFSFSQCTLTFTNFLSTSS